MEQPLAQLIIDAGNIAKGAGIIINRLSVQQRIISYKSTRDMVTEVDKAAEEYIISAIHKCYPKHNILAEESGKITNGDSDYRWIIDPLDGTTNFVHGFPVYAVSIAVEYQGNLTAAAVYDPNRDELFVAGKHMGALLNGDIINISTNEELGGSLLATGFSYIEDDYFKLNMDLWTSIYSKTQGLRRAGSAALDLAWLACGRLDGFWEFGLKPWDMAAGALLVTEAGGIVSNPSGAPLDLNQGHIIAANPHIHAEIVKEISHHRRNR